MAVELADVLEEIAKELQAAPSPTQTLEAVTDAAVDAIEGADYAGVSLVLGRRHIETVAGTDDVVHAIDAAQYETHEGPCLDAMYEQAVVRMADIDAERRWPDFTKRARGHGVQGILGFRLFMRGQDAGALNVYAKSRDAFTDDSLEVGRLLATHAAVALAAARKIDQLEHAVASRDMIGQAKGILMERHNLDADGAFQVLVRASQASDLRLVEVAKRVCDRDRGATGAG